MDLIRFALWTTVLFFAIILLGLSAGFIDRTEDASNDYFDSAAVLVAYSVLMILLSPLYIMASFLSRPFSIATTAWVELAVIFVLWLLVIGGSGGLSSDLDGLGDCGNFSLFGGGERTCEVGKATLAFGWMSWIVLTALMGFLIFVIVSTRDFSSHTHEVVEAGTGRGGSSSKASPTYPMQNTA